MCRLQNPSGLLAAHTSSRKFTGSDEPALRAAIAAAYDAATPAANASNTKLPLGVPKIDRNQVVEAIIALRKLEANVQIENGVFKPVQIQGLESRYFGRSFVGEVGSLVYVSPEKTQHAVPMPPQRFGSCYFYLFSMALILAIPMIVLWALQPQVHMFAGMLTVPVMLFIWGAVGASCCCGNATLARRRMRKGAAGNNCCCGCAILYNFLAFSRHIKDETELDQLFASYSTMTPTIRWGMVCSHTEGSGDNSRTVVTHRIDRNVEFSECVDATAYDHGLSMSQHRYVFTTFDTTVEIQDEDTLRELDRRRTQFITDNIRDKTNVFTERIEFPSTDMNDRMFLVLGPESQKNWFRTLCTASVFGCGDCVRSALLKQSHTLTVPIRKVIKLSPAAPSQTAIAVAEVVSEETLPQQQVLSETGAKSEVPIATATVLPEQCTPMHGANSTNGDTAEDESKHDQDLRAVDATSTQPVVVSAVSPAKPQL